MKKLSCLLIFFTLSSCLVPPTPLRLGFIGSTSGRGADLGIGGRNGAILAVEEFNARGGLQGHPVELVVQDSGGDVAEILVKGYKELVELGVVAVVGPMTSAEALTLIPLANKARLVLMGPTVSTKEVTGIDDYFFRTISATNFNAQILARYIFKTYGFTNFSAILDYSNQAYTQSWMDDFETEVKSTGGSIVRSIFVSGGDSDFGLLAQKLLSNRPQAIGLISNSLDTAILAKEIRNLNKDILIFTSGWGATERLIELSGQYSEGLLAPQHHDRESKNPLYLDFLSKYLTRFQQDPGYAGLLSFDATRIILDTLKEGQDSNALKGDLLQRTDFQGSQGPLVFDSFGDAISKIQITQIRDGKFRVVGP